MAVLYFARFQIDEGVTMYHWIRYLHDQEDSKDETLPVAPDSPVRIVTIVPAMRRIVTWAVLTLISCSLATLLVLELIARGMANGH